jgi:plastocyanin
LLWGLVVLFLGLSSGGQAAEERVIYLAAIEPKGGTMVDKEPYPAGELPKGGGYVKKAPDQNGRWEVSVYQFSPATVVVRQGERVTLELIGSTGKHSVYIDKYLPDHFVVTRGRSPCRVHRGRARIFTIHCKEHEPSMTGTLVVLPR